jgi:hypothetical protein
VISRGLVGIARAGPVVMLVAIDDLARVTGGQWAGQHSPAYHDAYADYMSRHCGPQMADVLLPPTQADALRARCKDTHNAAAETHASEVESQAGRR